MQRGFENMTPLEKFQNLLRVLFRFDCSDLDFGIYRIMNCKRETVERFITTELPAIINSELQRAELKSWSESAEDLEKKAGKVREVLGGDALDEHGNLSPVYRDTPLGKEYLALKERPAVAGRQAVEEEIFNRLHTFFARYYQDGDFVSKRRYSKRERYAIPYNGEEVALYWANQDQYYVKTAEHFQDYAFVSEGVSVRFKLIAADETRNNTKGETRFFLPRLDAMDWNEESSSLTIPFEFRPLTDEEASALGSGNNKQEKLVAIALRSIPEKLCSQARATLALAAECGRTGDGQPVCALERHLRRYVRRNSSDFFVHKDLKGFLGRELDFYLKNEVLNLDRMEHAGESLAPGWFQILRVIKSVGGRIVDFLAQIEGFQKRLWEKHKFVVETFYCIAVGCVHESFHPEIAVCDAQWKEWKELFALDEEQTDIFTNGLDRVRRRLALLRNRPSLTLDTRLFPSDFADRLLGSFEDLDGMTDGLLIHGENFHALGLLQHTYREQIKTVVIDPPYNRLGDSFPYKDDYRHSSWASMMRDRLAQALPLLRDDGAFFSNIDENERDMLQAILDTVFGRQNRIEELVWAQNTTHSQSPLYSTNHEYIEVYARNRSLAEATPSMFREPKPGFKEVMELVDELNPEYPPIREIESRLAELFEQHIAEYKMELHEQGLDFNEDTKRQDPWRGLYNYCHAEYRDSGGTLVLEKKAAKKRARICIWRESDPSAPSQKQSTSTKDPEHPNYRFFQPIHPITKKPCAIPKRGWACPYTWNDSTRESFESLMRSERIVWGEDETKIPQYKRFIHEVDTNVAKSFFHDYTDGEKQLAALFGSAGIFPTPKPTTLPMRFIAQTAGAESVVIDFFAGSGTTGHAAINLNRADGGRRRFILVEAGDHFDTVLLPRIRKAAYASDWKDGAPRSVPTPEETERSPRILKCVRLESYEDALGNIRFDEASGQAALAFGDYLLHYMLRWETKGSETLLNTEKLTSPFSYSLHIRTNGETRQRYVDTPETFAFLLGLRISSRKVYNDDGRRYLVHRGKTAEGRLAAVIWRETEGWGLEEMERDRRFVSEQRLAEGADEVFVNGDSLLPGARSLDALFKSRMFATAEE